MIVKNEEKTIERCLNSVSNIADEIVIIDTGSTDRTKELCKKYTDNVYDFKWINDFSAARNYSYSLASMDYILWLDADDILMPEDNRKLSALKETMDENIDVVMMKYATAMDSKGDVIFSYYRERLTKRNNNYTWQEPVHEHLLTFGNIMNSDVLITHAKPYALKENSSRNLKIYEENLEAGKTLSPRGTYYYARELKDHGRYADAIKQFELFLNTNAGWIEDNINACSELGKCYFEINLPHKALEAFFRSFVYDTPRAELCCQIGYYYQKKEDYEKSLYWFELILTLKKPEKSWGFLQHDCWDYIPFLECAVCNDKLGKYKKAETYNNRALKVHPTSRAALLNQRYLNEKVKDKEVKIKQRSV
jgi:glycosyltransferase involved in cell wall biosynthesis